ncbi:MAG: diguanylate cyclase [Methylocystis sp.]|uniref:diguanylate cyclase n=1 Tax=Methylocystis sp. TaxID=1911079 RepID=UPI003D0F3945
MPFSKLSRAQKRAALNELRQALFQHDLWYENFNRTIICRQVPDERDLREDANRRWPLGQWLHGAGANQLGAHPSFSQILAVHELMHRHAAIVLRTSSERRSIALDDYELFLSALKQVRAQLVSIKHELEELLRDRDPLTGAGNHAAMVATLRERQALAPKATCLAMMDIDHFKEVNDTYGHTLGDEFLVQYAEFVMSHLRPHDEFFRFGGEKFLYCAADADLRQGRAIAERLREGLSNREFFVEGYLPLTVTASFGLTPLDASVPVEQSIERADEALRAAKAAGRDRIATWRAPD